MGTLWPLCVRPLEKPLHAHPPGLPEERGAPGAHGLPTGVRNSENVQAAHPRVAGVPPVVAPPPLGWRKSNVIRFQVLVRHFLLKTL